VEQLTVYSHAKVNLSLDVLEKRPEDGYHYIRTVMVPISLADRVVLHESPEISVTMSPAIEGPAEANLAFRAAQLLRDTTGYAGGASIHVEKAIPVAGGLAGGSTNAAAALTGLNRLWGTGLTQPELIALAIQLGSDVPFFVPSRPARVEGIGERLTPIVVKRPLWLVLATPDVAKSTGNVFRLFDELRHVDRPDMAALEAALAGGDLVAVAAALGNVFEAVMLPRHPEIGMLKRAMLDLGALGALMSGAGPTVFGIVEDETAGRILEAGLGSLNARTSLVRTIGGDGDGD
jgi:4-diphosphocytidyl-2-C-methyl-D-erythritol kinase